MTSRATWTAHLVAAGLVAAALLLTAGVVTGLSGCEREEPVFEMKTPGLDVEVHKTDDGRTDIEIRTGQDAEKK